jgi:outer membrane biosynthesis protein TonB
MSGYQRLLIPSKRARAGLNPACFAIVSLPLFVFCGSEPKQARVPSGPPMTSTDLAPEPSASVLRPTLASNFDAGDTNDSARPMSSESEVLNAADSGAEGSVDGLYHGGLEPESIRRVVVAHAGALQACYEIEAMKGPLLRGGVTVRWNVEKNGAVTNAGVVESTIHSVNVEGCVLRQVRSWQFPSSAARSQATFPFVFGVRR